MRRRGLLLGCPLCAKMGYIGATGQGAGLLQLWRRLTRRCCPARPPGLLSDNNRLSELGKIRSKFEEIASDQRGEVKATVTTAEVRGGGAGAGQRQE